MFFTPSPRSLRYAHRYGSRSRFAFQLANGFPLDPTKKLIEIGWRLSVFSVFG